MNQNAPSEGDDLQDEVADVDAGEGEEDELQSVNGNGARKRIRQHANPAAEDASGDNKKTAKPNKVAYSAGEAAVFKKEIAAMHGKDDQRLKCAADDVICAVNFVFDSEFSNYDRKFFTSDHECQGYVFFPLVRIPLGRTVGINQQLLAFDFEF